MGWLMIFLIIYNKYLYISIYYSLLTYTINIINSLYLVCIIKICIIQTKIGKYEY